MVQTPTLQALYQKLKGKWIIGLHHNSAHANHRFDPPSLFDFHIAAPGDLKSIDNRPFTQIEMDCSNFSSVDFKHQEMQKKHWDVLAVGRNVSFKSHCDLLLVVRKIFDQQPIRVLAIVAHNGSERSQILADYLRLFSSEERKLFNLLTPTTDYPYPFDLKTLSHFYHSSSCFLHVARKERHPRVVAYAWAAGLPVIGRPQVACLLPVSFQTPPDFWAFDDIEDGAKKVLEALNKARAGYNRTPMSEWHLAENQKQRLVGELQSRFPHIGSGSDLKNWYLENLDIRLARHHVDDGLKVNLERFADILSRINEFNPTKGADIEAALDMHDRSLKRFSKPIENEIFWSKFNAAVSIKNLKKMFIFSLKKAGIVKLAKALR